ncbi:MAG: hypothetical protein LQ337_008503, partial [Flavoplaca oasis]
MNAEITNPQSVDRADTTAHFQRYYGPEFADYYQIKLENPAIELAMRSRGMDLADLGLWEVNAFDPVQKIRSKLMAFYNAFDTAVGIIVAKANYRSNDKTAPENKLQWSEIMYQTWKLASAQEKEEGKPYGPISNLRVVVQDQVENGETLKIVEAAYVNNNWEPDGDPEWRTWTEDSAQSFFYSILGTPNVKGTVWLLKDHAAEIGRKDISAIHTRCSSYQTLQINTLNHINRDLGPDSRSSRTVADSDILTPKKASICRTMRFPREHQRVMDLKHALGRLGTLTLHPIGTPPELSEPFAVNI